MREKINKAFMRQLRFMARVFAQHRKASIVALAVLLVAILVLVFSLRSQDKTVEPQKQSDNPIVQSYNQKLDSLKQTANNEPNNSAAHNAYAEALYITDNKLEAAKEYEAALRLDAKNATIQNNLGNTYRDLNQLEKAEGAYNKAIELSPADQKAYLNLANMQLYTQRNASKAIQTYQRAIQKLGPQNSLKILLGLAYEQNNQLEEARSTYQSVLSAEPNNQTAKNNLERIKN